MGGRDRTGEVTVLIATLGENPLLAEAVARARAQARARAAEVLLAVNTAEDALPPAARAALTAADRVIFEPRPGKSYALNSGIQAAAGELIAFLDDDAVPAPGWLDAITAPLRADSAIAGTGGRVFPVFPTGGPPPWYRRLVARSRSTFLGPFHDLGPQPRDYDGAGFVVPFGANCAFRRALLLNRGYLPELGPSRATGLRGGEDTELALRLLRGGARLRYCPGAIVYHPVDAARMSWDYVLRGYVLQGVEHLRLLRALGDPLPAAARLRRKIARAHLRGILAAAAGNAHKRQRQSLRRAFFRGQLQELAAP